MADTSADITELLNAAQSGDSDAQETAYALVYDELKRCARRQKAFVPGSSLSPTALVSELYLRLSGHDTDRIRNRAHFFALAARAMRQIIVDHARRRTSVKRGGVADHTDVATLDLATATAEQALELDAALTVARRARCRSRAARRMAFLRRPLVRGNRRRARPPRAHGAPRLGARARLPAAVDVGRRRPA